VDDVLDRGDDGVGSLAQDLQVVVGRRHEDGHTLAACLGLGGGGQLGDPLLVALLPAALSSGSRNRPVPSRATA
jgi:hypothetical protein